LLGNSRNVLVTKRGSNFFAEGNSKWGACNEVGTVIEKVASDVWIPNVKHFDEWD
jgi:hypothetical protein